MPFDEFFLMQGAKKQVSALTSKGKSFNATRKIRRFDDDFDPKTFATATALDTYIKAHQAMAG